MAKKFSTGATLAKFGHLTAMAKTGRRQAKSKIYIPDDAEFVRLGGIPWWKAKHAQHFNSNEHVSLSLFADYFGSHPEPFATIHIPPLTQRTNQQPKGKNVST